ELGFNAPGFQLPEPKSNKTRSLKELKGKKGTLVMFICNHCPYVIHLIKVIVEVAKEYSPKGISFVAINSNDVINYPDDSPDKMIEFADLNKFPFPYLYDESQQVAKNYFAECTPDFNLIDNHGKVIYRGRFDAATPGNNNPVNGADLKDALDRIIEAEPQVTNQIPSMGCSIKWK
ncbi:MAG: thioredoxin family protein, partial [Bacteroidetes bacterium]